MSRPAVVASLALALLLPAGAQAQTRPDAGARPDAGSPRGPATRGDGGTAGNDDALDEELAQLEKEAAQAAGAARRAAERVEQRVRERWEEVRPEVEARVRTQVKEAMPKVRERVRDVRAEIEDALDELEATLDERGTHAMRGVVEKRTASTLTVVDGDGAMHTFKLEKETVFARGGERVTAQALASRVPVRVLYKGEGKDAVARKVTVLDKKAE